MILVYSRDGCNSCQKVKSQLESMELDYREYKVGEFGDVTSEFIKENFPGKSMLPILVVNDEAFSGPTEIRQLFDEYGRDVEKELLNENNKAIGRFVNEGGLDPAKDA